jgi:hypothetical protein
LLGGAGGDTASYSTAGTSLTVSLTNPFTNTGDADGDSYSSIENLSGSNFGDLLVGNSGVNSLQGLGGDDPSSAAPAPTRSTAAKAATRRATREKPTPSERASRTRQRISAPQPEIPMSRLRI